MFEDCYWNLTRQGHEDPIFHLQPHLSEIHIGRASTSHLQCLSKRISRRHLEVHKHQPNPHDQIVWHLRDPGSQNGVFVNGKRIPKAQFIVLEDNDLISIGGNYSLRIAENQQIFIYKVHAPNVDSCTVEEENEESLKQRLRVSPRRKTCQYYK